VRFAIWRETLIDAAIFPASDHQQQQPAAPYTEAHPFCKLYYRARSAGLG